MTTVTRKKQRHPDGAILDVGALSDGKVMRRVLTDFAGVPTITRTSGNMNLSRLTHYVVHFTAASNAALPSSPTQDEEYVLVNVATSLADYVTVGRNGNTIDGFAQDFVVLPGETVVFRWDATDGWRTNLANRPRVIGGWDEVEFASTNSTETVFSITIPANLLRPNDSIVFDMFQRVRNASGGTRVLTAEFNIGGVTVYSGGFTPGNTSVWRIIGPRRFNFIMDGALDKNSFFGGGTGIVDDSGVGFSTSYAGASSGLHEFAMDITDVDVDTTSDWVLEHTLLMNVSNANYQNHTHAGTMMLIPGNRP